MTIMRLGDSIIKNMESIMIEWEALATTIVPPALTMDLDLRLLGNRTVLRSGRCGALIFWCTGMAISRASSACTFSRREQCDRRKSSSVEGLSAGARESEVEEQG